MQKAVSRFLVAPCILLAALFLSGCQTPTAAEQRQADIAQRMRAAVDRGDTCVRSLQGSPEEAFVAERLPVRVNAPATLAQLSNTARPTPAEVEQLNRWYATAVACRVHYIEAADAMSPTHVAIVRDAQTRRDVIFAGLARREIAWGVAAERLVEVNSSVSARLAEADQQLHATLSAENQAELQNRQAGWAALATGLQRASDNLNQQQQLNAINRPRTTNCYRIGNTVNCSTY